MSASRSWDIQPKRDIPAPPPKAQPKRRIVRTEPVRASKPVKRAPRREPLHTEPLKVRRQKQRKAFMIAMGVLGVILFGAVMFGIWQPAVRVHAIQAEGPNAEAAKVVAQQALYGTYWYVLPRNSIFFYPEDEIRKRVQAEFPDVAAVSVSRSAFNELQLITVSRISAFVWCGPTFDTPNPDGVCFNTDAEGFVFKQADSAENASSTLRIFAPLATEDPSNPLRSKVIGAQHIPDTLRFVKAIRMLGLNVMAISIRGDEADIWVPGPTRITYVLGKEEEAAILAQSAFPTLNFENASIQYVDLRFSKKVYVKRYGE